MNAESTCESRARQLAAHTVTGPCGSRPGVGALCPARPLSSWKSSHSSTASVCWALWLCNIVDLQLPWGECAYCITFGVSKILRVNRLKIHNLSYY